jgi:hypothetical protein
MRPNEQDNQLIWETLKEAGDWPSMGPREAGDDSGPDPAGNDDDNAKPPRVAEVGDFEKELVDLYWQVVDSGVDESLAGDWFDGVRLSLSELLHDERVRVHYKT